MKIKVVKFAGGVTSPASDIDAEKMSKLKTGEQYEIEIKQTRNPQFHRKVFAFLGFCFQHWSADHTECQFMDESAQFDTFREHITVLAGYYETTYNLKGDVRIRARSLSFGNMSQEEFEQFYSAAIRVAVKHIFNGTTDEKILNQLQSFF
jgi:hypothetical protein